MAKCIEIIASIHPFSLFSQTVPSCFNILRTEQPITVIRKESLEVLNKLGVFVDDNENK